MKLLRKIIPIAALLAIGAMVAPASASTTVEKATYNGNVAYLNMYSNNECGTGWASTYGRFLSGTMKDSATGAVTHGLAVEYLYVYGYDCSSNYYSYYYDGGPVSGTLTMNRSLRSGQLNADVELYDWNSDQTSTFTYDVAFTGTSGVSKFTNVYKWTDPDGTSYSDSSRGSQADADVTGSATDGVLTVDGDGNGNLERVTSGLITKTVS